MPRKCQLQRPSGFRVEEGSSLPHLSQRVFGTPLLFECPSPCSPLPLSGIRCPGSGLAWAEVPEQRCFFAMLTTHPSLLCSQEACIPSAEVRTQGHLGERGGRLHRLQGAGEGGDGKRVPCSAFFQGSPDALLLPFLNSPRVSSVCLGEEEEEEKGQAARRDQW